MKNSKLRPGQKALVLTENMLSPVVKGRVQTVGTFEDMDGRKWQEGRLELDNCRGSRGANIRKFNRGNIVAMDDPNRANIVEAHLDRLSDQFKNKFNRIK